MKVFAVVLLFAFAYGATIPEDQPEEVEEFQLPDFVKTCYEDDPKLGECVKEAVSDMMPRLNNGLKSLNIPPLDPFTIERTSLEYGNGALQGAIKMKNLKTFGMSQAVFRDVRMKIEDGKVETEIDIHFPKIFMEGAYKADIKFNELKLHPKGHFNVTMTNINTTHHWEGHLVPKNGHQYLQIDTFDMIPEIGDMKIYVGGIFPDPAMNQIAVNFLNQYWPAFYKMLLPETRSHWQPLMTNSINEFLGRVPFDLLVKKRE